MLKNVSSAPITMLWGGQATTLLPGQTCRYRDPKVELRMKAKHGAALQHTEEPKAKAEAEAQVTVDAPPATGGVPTRPGPDAPEPEPEGAPKGAAAPGPATKGGKGAKAG